MTHIDRLLHLLQILRQQRQPVCAGTLAVQLAVSERTIYRDIDRLRAQGADIQGEAGVGFWLKRDFLLPPMQFSEDEIAALVFGMRWVKQCPDPHLRDSADAVLAKIHATLPAKIADRLINQQLYPVSHSVDDERYVSHFGVVRQAIADERYIKLHYKDLADSVSERTLVPLAMGYFDGHVALLAAFCLLRQDFRHFRIDRILAIDVLDKHNQPTALLTRQWQAQCCIDVSAQDLSHLARKT